MMNQTVGSGVPRPPKPRYRSCLLLVCLLSVVLPGVAAAADWSSTDVQLLHGDDFQLGDETREIITLPGA